MSKRTYAVLGAGSLAVLILFALFSFSRAVFVNKSESRSVRAVSDVLPVPAARLGARWILYRDYLRARDTLRAFLASPAAREINIQAPLNADLEKNVLERLLTKAALEEFAAQKNISVTEAELRRAFSEALVASSSTAPDVSVYLLETYGWNEEDFRQEVIRPAVLEEKLVEKLKAEGEGDEGALGKYLSQRLQEKNVVRYLRF